MNPKLIGLGVVALAAVAVVGGVLASSDDSGIATDDATTSVPDDDFSTAVVARKDLVETTEVDGTLGFGDPTALPNRSVGVLTQIPEAGTIVSPGDVLYEVNEMPVVYLPGEIPAYRTMRDNVEGTDVLQLEEYLDSLGLMEANDATVDSDFTWYTENAVEEWYETTFGVMEQTSVDDGMVIFGTEPFRISQVTVQLGGQVNGGSVLSYTSTTRVVTVKLDTALSGILEEGQTVVVELPDESEVNATVTFVSDTVTTEGQGPSATSWIDVELVLEGEGSAFDESPVVIRVDEPVELDAVVVPIASLVALAEGGYAVEKLVDGIPVLVAVEIGSFLSNEVSITGAIEPGDIVIVP